MDKQLCFVIDGQNLFLEKTLVFFNDIPIFFICRNERKQPFLVLCTELDRLEYLIVETELYTLREMLNQRCTMRNAILQGTNFWKVVSGDTIENDLCEKIDKSKIELDSLPNEGAVYNKIFKEDESYADQIESEYLNNSNYESMNQIENLMNDFDSLVGISEDYNISIYTDIGPSVNSATNGTKRLFSDCKLNIENSQKIKYKLKKGEKQTGVVIEERVLTINDCSVNLAA